MILTSHVKVVLILVKSCKIQIKDFTSNFQTVSMILKKMMLEKTNKTTPTLHSPKIKAQRSPLIYLGDS